MYALLILGLLWAIDMNIRNKFGTIDWRYIIIEISIIVIGILIALQVDNWKDDRNTRLKELKVLHELSSELLGDLKTLDETQKRCEDVISALGTLQMHLYKKLAYHDSLNNQAFKMVYQIRYEYRKSAFENLKSIGVELISNDSLKKMLIELYEYSYPRHLKIIDIEANSEKYRVFTTKIEFMYTDKSKTIKVLKLTSC
jgi:Family of unknown function (DUF6090)